MKRTQKNPTIGIVGLGMVGTPLLKYFEHYKGYQRGFDLFCFDADTAKGYLDDVSLARIIFVAVPTPLLPGGSCDTSIVESIIARYAACSPSPTFVVKSTVVPGTCEELARKYNVPILFNPEFLTEANAWNDFLHPDRQIVGAAQGAEKYTEMVFSLLPKPVSEQAMLRMNATEAELVKYRSNLFGAMKVSFANAIAVLSRLYDEILGVPIDEQSVLQAVGLDRRIGQSWFALDSHGYRGYGGFCFPKDINAQITRDKEILSCGEKWTKKYNVRVAAIMLMEAMRDFNRILLDSQGLSEEEVSQHDAELAQKSACKKEKQ